MDHADNMVQYGVWTNCCNNCDFCLREQRRPYTKAEQLLWLQRIRQNIRQLDWENEFTYGVSLLGGELYFVTDPEVQDSFMELIDVIIECVLKKSKNPACRYSTVTNGLYDPAFLYRVVDRIAGAVGLKYVDLNFSYDLRHRFSKEEDRLLCLRNINAFHERYGYDVCVQMILAQYVIDMWKAGEFQVREFERTQIPGNRISFLYPHPVKTGVALGDFFPRRRDLLEFLRYLRRDCLDTYYSFLHSTKNSCRFKYTGLRDRARDDADEKPRLSDGKQIINPRCGHSTLYKCYADSDKCILCDLLNLDREAYL